MSSVTCLSPANVNGPTALKPSRALLFLPRQTSLRPTPATLLLINNNSIKIQNKYRGHLLRFEFPNSAAADATLANGLTSPLFPPRASRFKRRRGMGGQAPLPAPRPAYTTDHATLTTLTH